MAARPGGARRPAGQLLWAFAQHGRVTPYTDTLAKDPDRRPYQVTAAHCKTGIAASRQSMVPHLVAAAAAVLVDGVLTFGTQWLCSPYPCGSQDAVFITDPDALGGLCKRCSVLGADGPGVYRFLNQEERLLYVGSSGTVLTRSGWQQENAPWRSLIADLQITRFPSLLEARAAEAAAIGTESPLMNKSGTKRAGAA